MPHFVIECSENVLAEGVADQIMDAVYDVAELSGLFAANDIKVRLHSFKYYKLAENKESFLHVFAYVMEGRSIGQKSGLSRQMIERLNQILPGVSFLSMNVTDFQFQSYCNRSLINPLNTNNDRHFEL